MIEIQNMDIIELSGWVGAIMLLIAYSANLLEKVKNDAIIFLVTNIVGSGLLIVNAYANRAYPFIIINVFWFLVSIYQLAKLGKGKG